MTDKEIEQKMAVVGGVVFERVFSPNGGQKNCILAQVPAAVQTLQPRSLRPTLAHMGLDPAPCPMRETIKLNVILTVLREIEFQA